MAEHGGEGAPGPLLLARHRIELALHRLADGAADRPPLLLLHALGGRTVPDGGTGPLGVGDWPGPVWALDFTGHGRSTRPVGGGYCPEVLMADADRALAAIGPAVVCGWGLGGYVGLLLAGARPEAVLGLVVADGHGLAGSTADPSVVHIVEHPPPPLPVALPGVDPTADPYAWAELQVDHRPPDYALGYLRRAAAHPGRDAGPVVGVAAGPDTRAAWLDAIEAEPSVLARTELPVSAGTAGPDRVAAALAVLSGR